MRGSRQPVPLTALTTRLETLLREKTSVRLAIDGNSAAGKTTLSQWLAMRYDGTVFHMDDFFLQAHQRTSERLAEPGGNVDRERFQKEVIVGLQSGKPFEVRAFDCVTMTLGAPEPFNPTRLSIVEGAYCLHPELVDAWDLNVFLSLDPETQSARILARNGPERHKRFLVEWIPMEEHYFSAFHIKERCDFLLDGRVLSLTE